MNTKEKIKKTHEKQVTNAAKKDHSAVTEALTCPAL